MKKTKPFRSLEETFSLIYDMACKGPVSIERIFKIFSFKKELYLLVLFSLLALVFSQFVFMQLLVGFISLYVASTILFGVQLVLPEFMLRKQLPKPILKHAAYACLRIVRVTKKVIRPRIPAVCQGMRARYLNGSLIALLGAILMISSFLSMPPVLLALSLLFISLGLLEDDGFIVILGYIETATVITAAFFGLF